jgi:hypothetical protein
MRALNNHFVSIGRMINERNWDCGGHGNVPVIVLGMNGYLCCIVCQDLGDDSAKMLAKCSHNVSR